MIGSLVGHFTMVNKMAAEDQKAALLEELSDVVGQVRSDVVCTPAQEDF